MSDMGKLRDVTLAEKESFRVTDAEYKLISKMCENSHMSRSDVWRSLLWTVTVVFDPDLKIGDAVRPEVASSMRIRPNIARRHFSSMLKSLPELQKISNARFLGSIERSVKRRRSPAD